MLTFESVAIVISWSIAGISFLIWIWLSREFLRNWILVKLGRRGERYENEINFLDAHDIVEKTDPLRILKGTKIGSAIRNRNKHRKQNEKQ
ncbi:MAG: hypothetical protein OXH90_12195 [Paracoccaceae bacterium]|nr:hypothetical protein [Paracoccaceae bacterium]MDE2917073.1 hypothetical protein [Paracoccaceae bacterium]